MDVRISDKADADIRDIYKYSYHQFGEVQADRYYSALWTRLRFLAQHPQLGRERPEFDPMTRSHHHRRHVIFYDVFDDHILVVRILHERMDIARHMRHEE